MKDSSFTLHSMLLLFLCCGVAIASDQSLNHLSVSYAQANRSGDYREIIKECDVVLMKDPHTAAVLLLKSRAQARQKDYQGSIESINRYFAVFEDIIQHHSIKASKAEAMEIPAFIDVIRLGKFEKDNYPFLRDFIGRFMQAEPNSKLPYRLLGFFGIAANDPAALEMAVSHLPKSGEERVFRAYLALLKGERQTAQRRLDEAFNIAPDYILAKTIQAQLNKKTIPPPM